MGKAPLHTTIDELEKKAPPIEVPKDEYSKGWKNFGNSTYLPRAKTRLDRADRVGIRGDREKSEPMELYVQLERHCQPVMISGSLGHSGPSRMFGNIQPAILPLGVMTEEWHRDTTILLEKARLMDYRVDADWISAADTYFHFVRNALIAAIPKEPQFQHVLADWAKSRYHLDQVTNKVSAGRALEALQAQVDKDGAYQTNSITGDAVEYLIDHLDSDRVIAIANTKLKQHRRWRMRDHPQMQEQPNSKSSCSSDSTIYINYIRKTPLERSYSYRIESSYEIRTFFYMIFMVREA